VQFSRRRGSVRGGKVGMAGDDLPIFLIASADNDFRYHIVWAGFWDWGVDDLDLGTFEDECFFHFL
jgi:hypothetical protein